MKLRRGKKVRRGYPSSRGRSKQQPDDWVQDLVRRIEEKVDGTFSAVRRVEEQLMKIKTPVPALTSVENLEVYCLPFKSKWECKDIKCRHCTVEQRNACWLHIKREGKRKSLLGGMPYSEGQLKQFKRNELVVIMGALALNPFKMKDSTTDGIIKSILNRQEMLGLEESEDEEEED